MTTNHTHKPVSVVEQEAANALPTPAPWSARLLGRMIDYFVSFFLAIPLIPLLGLDDFVRYGGGSTVVHLTCLVYVWLSEYLFQRTIGKMLMGTVVVDARTGGTHLFP